VGAVGAALGRPLLDNLAIAETPAAAARRRNAPGGPYNILFILTDQERHFRPNEMPAGFRLPAHERLAKKGVVFENHRISSCVCTSSRSVLYTGRHIQHTRMFDNVNFPWVQSMSTEIKTLGHLLREAGYYTAYKGKWHLTREFETANKLAAPEKIFTKEMEAYGFADYLGVGDIIAHTQGGYLHDGMIAASAASWLKGRAADLAQQGKPWFLAVNLVNPHDVMFYNTDRPGEPVQERTFCPTSPAIRRMRCTRSSGNSICRPVFRSRSTPPGGPRRTPSTSSRTVLSRARSRSTSHGAGASATTSISIACATWIATSPRCSTNWRCAGSLPIPSSS
jgi:hypothetical protein